MQLKTTAIGSLPHKDVADAIRLVCDTLSIPAWPQLPNISYKENMLFQISQVFPGIKYIDGSLVVSREAMLNQLADFYENVFADNIDHFKITKDFAVGLWTMVDKKTLPFIKGQLVGPITFGLSVKFDDGKPIIFDEELSRILPLFINFKARWQINKLKTTTNNIYIFLDEPALQLLGKADLPLSPLKAVELINTAVEKIEDAVIGVHCCGNCDWAALLDLPINILSIDAHRYITELLLYKSNLRRFLGRGGIVALGLVPTDETTFIDTQLIANRIEEIYLKLSEINPFSELILTPSCGLATLSEDRAEQILKTIKELHQRYL